MLLGDCFVMPAPGTGSTPHLWFVVTSPAPDCLILSLTTLRKGKDQTVILQPGDHPFVRHASCIFYSDARMARADSIEGLLQTGLAVRQPPCSPELLRQIQAGILASPFTPRKIQDYYRRWRAGQS